MVDTLFAGTEIMPWLLSRAKQGMQYFPFLKIIVESLKILYFVPQQLIKCCCTFALILSFLAVLFRLAVAQNMSHYCQKLKGLCLIAAEIKIPLVTCTVIIQQSVATNQPYSCQYQDQDQDLDLDKCNKNVSTVLSQVVFTQTELAPSVLLSQLDLPLQAAQKSWSSLCK